MLPLKTAPEFGFIIRNKMENQVRDQLLGLQPTCTFAAEDVEQKRPESEIYENAAGKLIFNYSYLNGLDAPDFLALYSRTETLTIY